MYISILMAIFKINVNNKNKMGFVEILETWTYKMTYIFLHKYSTIIFNNSSPAFLWIDSYTISYIITKWKYKIKLLLFFFFSNKQTKLNDEQEHDLATLRDCNCSYTQISLFLSDL